MEATPEGPLNRSSIPVQIVWATVQNERKLSGTPKDSQGCSYGRGIGITPYTSPNRWRINAADQFPSISRVDTFLEQPISHRTPVYEDQTRPRQTIDILFFCPNMVLLFCFHKHFY